MKSGRVTFGCFDSAIHLNKEVLILWSQILTSVPESRLLLCNPEVHASDYHNQLRSQFQAMGIDRQRLVIFARRETPLAASLYEQIDVYLDPVPLSGSVSIASALWHGVPAVTLRGDRFGSCLGASLLAAAGLNDLVASSPEDYVSKAASLAISPQLLKDLRPKLSGMTVTHELCDVPRFTANGKRHCRKSPA